MQRERHLYARSRMVCIAFFPSLRNFSKQGLIVTAPTHVLIALRILTKHTLSGDTHTEERALKDARSDFRTVTDLDDHLAEYSLTDLLKYTREAVYWTSLMKNIPKLSTITSTDLLRHILQIRTNAFAITKVF